MPIPALTNAPPDDHRAHDRGLAAENAQRRLPDDRQAPLGCEPLEGSLHDRSDRLIDRVELCGRSKRSRRSIGSSTRIVIFAGSGRSCPPIETTGTIGTPVASASRTNPSRPANSILWLCHDGRWASHSPPGYTSTADPIANAACAPAWVASIVPYLRRHESHGAYITRRWAS